MKKQNTIIRARINTDGSVKLYVNTIDVEVTPNFIIPRSNFSTGSPDGAFLIGVPCKVISEPYIIKEKNVFGETKNVEVYDVRSMVTNIKYTIPTGWADEYDTLEEANKHALIKGTEHPSPTDLISRKYWPRDNSYILDFKGDWKSLIKKECWIISVPFKEKTYDEYPDEERTFILVMYEGKTYRVLFEEWALADPE